MILQSAKPNYTSVRETTCSLAAKQFYSTKKIDEHLLNF